MVTAIYCFSFGCPDFLCFSAAVCSMRAKAKAKARAKAKTIAKARAKVKVMQLQLATTAMAKAFTTAGAIQTTAPAAGGGFVRETMRCELWGYA